MCGTAGMFIGCAAVAFCPKSILLGSQSDEISSLSDSADITPPPYRSPFRDWDQKSSVRAAPRRIIGDDRGKLYFSPDLVPAAQHPFVKDLPDELFKQLLVQHLYRYLDFTAVLECFVVNRTLLGIAYGSVGITVPETMRFDALKMYCDEAYHALLVTDVARQVQEQAGSQRKDKEQPYFLRRLNYLLSSMPSADRGLAEVLFVIISETLISATLATGSWSEEVEPAVLDSIHDHARDEGKHHAYFSHFLKVFWSQLSPDERQRASMLVPCLIKIFLRPDTQKVKDELGDYGLTSEQAEQVVAEVYSPELVQQQINSTSRLVRKYFTDLGAFSSPEAADELHVQGFPSDS
jgi:hypothetical protein